MTIIDPPDYLPEYRQQIAKALYVLSDNLKDIERFSNNFELLNDSRVINKYKEVMEKWSLLEKSQNEYDELLYELQKKNNTYLSTQFNSN